MNNHKERSFIIMYCIYVESVEVPRQVLTTTKGQRRISISWNRVMKQQMCYAVNVRNMWWNIPLKYLQLFKCIQKLNYSLTKKLCTTDVELVLLSAGWKIDARLHDISNHCIACFVLNHWGRSRTCKSLLYWPSLLAVCGLKYFKSI